MIVHAILTNFVRTLMTRTPPVPSRGPTAIKCQSWDCGHAVRSSGRPWECQHSHWRGVHPIRKRENIAVRRKHRGADSSLPRCATTCLPGHTRRTSSQTLPPPWLVRTPPTVPNSTPWQQPIAATQQCWAPTTHSMPRPRPRLRAPLRKPVPPPPRTSRPPLTRCAGHAGRRPRGIAPTPSVQMIPPWHCCGHR